MGVYAKARGFYIHTYNRVIFGSNSNLTAKVSKDHTVIGQTKTYTVKRQLKPRNPQFNRSFKSIQTYIRLYYHIVERL